MRPGLAFGEVGPLTAPGQSRADIGRETNHGVRYFAAPPDGATV